MHLCVWFWNLSAHIVDAEQMNMTHALRMLIKFVS